LNITIKYKMFAERYRAEMRYPGYMGVGLEVSVKVYPSIKRVMSLQPNVVDL